jgi:hypothetical protein
MFSKYLMSQAFHLRDKLIYHLSLGETQRGQEHEFVFQLKLNYDYSQYLT